MEGAELIIQEINREAEQKIQYLLAEAQKEAEKLKEEAKKRAEAKAEWILRKAKTQAEIEKQRIIANAKLEVRKKKLAVQEKLIKEVLEDLREELKSIPEEKYIEVLARLVAEAVRELRLEKVVVHSNERTLELLRRDEFKTKLQSNLAKTVTIVIGEPIETVGGVVVESPDGKVRVDNTFEARMERLEDMLRKRIAEVLFG